MKYYVGIDLGGTNTKIGLLDENGNTVFSILVKTDSYQGYEATLERLCKTTKEEIAKNNIDYTDVVAAGIGIPGPVVNNSTVLFWANFDWPPKINIAKECEKYLERPVFVDNDVNVITMGELWQGSAKGSTNVVGLAIGTGIGGGIVVDNKLISGKSGAGGEIGHIKLYPNGKLCGCGSDGCFEAYGSATGLIREAESRLKVNKNNLLFKMTEGREIEAKDIFDAAKQGDEFSLKLVDYEIEVLAIGLGNILNTIDPEVIVIGGGIALAGNILFDGLKDRLSKYALPSTLDNLKIKPAELGNDAGIYGAAYLAMTKVQ